MRTIYIMSGLPGSGKTQYTLTHARWGDLILHRDEFRERLRAEHGTDNYFPLTSKQEFTKWTDYIRELMLEFPYDDIYIDQTTLTQKAAERLLRAITPATSLDRTKFTFVMCRPALTTCFERNAKREGHDHVPVQVIRNMHASMQNNPIDPDTIRRRFPGFDFDFIKGGN